MARVVKSDGKYVFHLSQIPYNTDLNATSRQMAFFQNAPSYCMRHTVRRQLLLNLYVTALFVSLFFRVCNSFHHLLHRADLAVLRSSFFSSSLNFSYCCCKCHTFFGFGYSQRRSNLLNRGIAKYVRPMTSIMVINKLISNGRCPK